METFGISDNHSIAYCLIGYFCGWLRHYYPLEFITSYLNNADNEGDIARGTEYADKIGVKVTMPKWGISKGDYFFSKERNTIAKGISSIKYMSPAVADKLYELAEANDYKYFTELLYDLNNESNIDTRQLDILISIDFFTEFGNQRELQYITNMFYKNFKRGEAKTVNRATVDGTKLQSVVQKYAVGTTKSGGVAKRYTLLDVKSLLLEIEEIILAENLPDVNIIAKVKSFKEAAGYLGYVSNKEEERPLLYVLELYPLKRRKDGKQFGYSVITKSIGSGKETRFSVFNRVYDKAPIQADDVIFCKGYTLDNGYFTLTNYEIIK